MTTSLDPLRRSSRLPAGPAAAAALLEPAVAEAAGAGVTPVSLTLDYGAAAAAGDDVTVEAWVDRATRTLVFAHGRLLSQADGGLVATASAVFRRAAADGPVP